MPLSFYALLAVGGLHLITFIMLICIVCCKGKDDGENEPEEEEVLPDAYGEVNMYGEEAYPTEPNPGVANGWVKTFPSNIEFADGKMGREGDLYRGFYGYVQSAVFGSA
ncbi:unnamed protein product [Dibothriocephalus latus]|uniref:Uncharacterized protein n=1 Tax=Dibothriocephalus latus TaxID=60516 RepID=A0A3P6TUE3_DIBLA|nr:unnamed protein product [Dibothriocephalus latus]